MFTFFSFPVKNKLFPFPFKWSACQTHKGFDPQPLHVAIALRIQFTPTFFQLALLQMNTQPVKLICYLFFYCCQKGSLEKCFYHISGNGKGLSKQLIIFFKGLKYEHRFCFLISSSQTDNANDIEVAADPRHKNIKGNNSPGLFLSCCTQIYNYIYLYFNFFII